MKVELPKLGLWLLSLRHDNEVDAERIDGCGSLIGPWLRGCSMQIYVFVTILLGI